MGINVTFHQRKGQVAPLMLLFIAVILVSMMVVFNIGKVSLNKVNTQNAADAGALAASSWLASGANMVADIGQMMNYATLGFNAVMICIAWPTHAHAYAIVATFCLDQALILDQADYIDDLVHERAGESALIYAFINAGVDQQAPEPEADEDYKSWRKEESPFSEFLQNANYKSGEYAWDRWSKYERWDKKSKQFTTFKKERPCKVKVDVGHISHINYSIGILPGLTWACQPCLWGCCWWPAPYIVIPANITVHGNRSAGVKVTREEAGADWGLWEMEIPTISSSATAKTEGSGSIWSGGNFDCNITGVE
ncbi:MAG: hypothetical protein D4S01_05190 [Dehalococcoidia bacterium]|nr:MAG: hypothetical protein D4S01_05190 [Dehalococcoidia bacterium]